jgi:small conductance mechanosensitive channel
MAVGDVVKLGDKGGVVEALSIRTVRLRDLAGVVHTIPFSSIEGVSNLTREFSFHVFEIGIAYREDVDGVVGLLKQIGEELRADVEIGPLILEPLEVFGLDAFGDSAIVIKGRIKTRPIKQWQVGRAFNRLVKIRFDEHGIEIPFPHRTLYFGQDKDGTAPPAFVELESMMQKASGGSAK